MIRRPTNRSAFSGFLFFMFVMLVFIGLVWLLINAPVLVLLIVVGIIFWWFTI